MAAKQRVAVFIRFWTFHNWMNFEVEWVLSDSIAKCRACTENMSKV